MFTQTDIDVANNTSRASGAIGKNAITPKFVRQHIELFYEKEDTTILDFGAGQSAVHAQSMLKDDFFNNCL